MPEEDEIDLYLIKSSIRLTAAKNLLESGFYDDAVGRAYYAMFFSAKAMLLQKNVTTKTHRGLISAFGSEYVQKNIVSAEFGRMLSIAEELREEVDYSVVHVITREEALDIIDNAQKFIMMAKTVLKKQ